VLGPPNKKKVFGIWCVKIWAVTVGREQVTCETSASVTSSGVYGHTPPVALSHRDSPRHRRRLGSFPSIIAFFLFFCVPLIIFSVHLLSLSLYIAFLSLPVLFFSYTLDISV